MSLIMAIENNSTNISVVFFQKLVSLGARPPVRTISSDAPLGSIIEPHPVSDKVKLGGSCQDCLFYAQLNS